MNEVPLMSSKNKNRQQQHQQKKGVQPAAATKVAPTPALQEPTPEQTERLKLASMEVEALTAEHGPAPLVEVSEQARATLEESLQRVEGLLQGARAHFNKAREHETAAKAEEDRLSAQKRDQDEAFRTKRRQHEADLIGMKKAADEEVVAKLKAADVEISIKRNEWEQAELDLLQRIESADGREQALTRREAANRVKEAELVEQGYRLAERELNAEQGFLTEKLRILRPVEVDVTRLREERDRLDGEITELREKAETELRAKARARAERWAEEDAARTEAEAEARRKLDEAVALERQNKLHALRAELLTEREQAEADWLEELSRRRTALDN
ncbi:hypothetical protein L6R46_28245, partial [Myxococcota bacterium]|nr:hypothetical protein [Myxococcota bacterium]